jgi:hypothetical protein
MGFNKRIVGPEQIKGIEKDLTTITRYLNSDCLIFVNNEVEQKFKEYEKKYVPNRINVI